MNVFEEARHVAHEELATLRQVCEDREKRRRAATFVIEQHNNETRLGVDNGRGTVTWIATFIGAEAPAIFNEVLALAKAAAHEHGRSGI